MTCLVCEDCGWVCEVHQDQPREGQHACTCGAASVPCPAISRLPIIPGPLRLVKGLQLTRRHDCIPISIWLHNQIVNRMVISVP